jgi:hypothetical protein
VLADVDNLRDTDALEEHIQESAVMLLFLSKGYLQSHSCMREVRATLQKKKPYLLVHEADAMHGGAALAVLQNELHDLKEREVLFRVRCTITWQRIAELQEFTPLPWLIRTLALRGCALSQVEALKIIAEQMLAFTPAYNNSGGSLSLFAPGSLLQQSFVFPRRVFLYVSSNNPGAKEVAEEMSSRYEKLDVTQSTMALDPFRWSSAGTLRAFQLRKLQRLGAGTCGSLHGIMSPRPASPPSAPAAPTLTTSAAREPEEKKVTHFLLCLNQLTFIGQQGVALAKEVKAARTGGLRVVIVHENDESDDVRKGCQFGTGFQKVRCSKQFPISLHLNSAAQFDVSRPSLQTPQYLVDDGLYKSLAITFAGDERLRAVSRMLLAQHLGAVKSKVRLRAVSCVLAQNRSAGKSKGSSRVLRRLQRFLPSTESSLST